MEYIGIYRVEYKGPRCSLNDFINKHWRERKRKTDPIKNLMYVLIHNAKLPFINKFHLTIRHNTHYDVDNCVAMGKLFVDQMKAKGKIKDDKKKHYHSLHVVPDELIEKGAINFIIKVIA